MNKPHDTETTSTKQALFDVREDCDQLSKRLEVIWSPKGGHPENAAVVARDCFRLGEKLGVLRSAIPDDHERRGKVARALSCAITRLDEARMTLVWVGLGQVRAAKARARMAKMHGNWTNIGRDKAVDVRDARGLDGAMAVHALRYAWHWIGEALGEWYPGEDSEGWESHAQAEFDEVSRELEEFVRELGNG